MSPGAPDQLSSLLQDVSRSFYLTLRVLPKAIRRPISLAYLLARSTDTVADTDAVSKDQRLQVLADLQNRLHMPRAEPLHLSQLAGPGTSPAEQLLLQRIDEIFALLDGLEPPDQERIREVVTIIISGQMLDVTRFGEAGAGHMAALRNDLELDDYTYRVAGCVGEFWTQVCRAHLFPQAPLDEALLRLNGVRFGKGLQLVNILRDLPADLRLGRCYLPEDELERIGLRPVDLLTPAREDRLRQLFDRYLDRAEDHLRAGWAYTLHLPYWCARVRLACAWPILIGVQTIGRLRSAPILESGTRVKISRKEVRRILSRSVVWYAWPQRWSRLFDALNTRSQNTLLR